MRIIVRFLVGLLVLSSAPVVWGQVHSSDQHRPADPVALVGEALAEYGRWLNAVQVKQAQIGIVMAQVRAAWQTAGNRADRVAAAREFRAAAQQYAGRIDAINAEINAIPLPATFTETMEKDVQPASLRTALVNINAQLGQIVLQSTQVTDAVAKGDYVAAKRGSTQMMKGMAGVIRSQILMARANLATEDPAGSVYATMEFDLMYLKVVSRLMDGLVAVYARPTIDRAMADELAAMAKETDATADRGAALLENDIKALADQSGSLVDKVRRMRESMRQNFALAHRFATTVREIAGTIRTRTLSADLLSAALAKLRPLKEDMDRLEHLQTGIIAG